MSKPTSESVDTSPLTAQQLNEAITAVELRCRRQARDDFQSVLRGQLADLVVHCENRLESRVQSVVEEKLRSHTDALRAMLEADRGYFTRFRATLKDEIKAVCVETLQEYQLLDENLYPVPAATKAGN